jgi:hypothetical protein
MPAMTMPLPGSLTRFTNPQTVAASSNARAVPSNGDPCHPRNDISSIPRIICSGDIEPSVHGLLNKLRIVVFKAQRMNSRTCDRSWVAAAQARPREQRRTLLLAERPVHHWIEHALFLLVVTLHEGGKRIRSLDNPSRVASSAERRYHVLDQSLHLTMLHSHHRGWPPGFHLRAFLEGWEQHLLFVPNMSAQFFSESLHRRRAFNWRAISQGCRAQG